LANEINAKDLQVLKALGTLKFIKGDLEGHVKSLKWFKIATLLHPYDHSSWVKLGCALATVDKILPAISSF
jgi:hypothetical protein